MLQKASLKFWFWGKRRALYEYSSLDYQKGVMKRDRAAPHRQLGHSRPPPSQKGSGGGDVLLLPAALGPDGQALREGPAGTYSSRPQTPCLGIGQISCHFKIQLKTITFIKKTHVWKPSRN